MPEYKAVEAEVIDAEIVDEKKPQDETRVSQVSEALELARLRTERVKARWQALGTMVIALSFFASCAWVCNPL